MIKQLTALQAQDYLLAQPNAVLLDVREPWEVQLAAVKRPFVHMHMQSVPARLNELPQDGPIVCLCHHGMRSNQVAHFLLQQGYEEVFNLEGGIAAWSQTVDASVNSY